MARSPPSPSPRPIATARPMTVGWLRWWHATWTIQVPQIPVLLLVPAHLCKLLSCSSNNLHLASVKLSNEIGCIICMGSSVPSTLEPMKMNCSSELTSTCINICFQACRNEISRFLFLHVLDSRHKSWWNRMSVVDVSKCLWWKLDDTNHLLANSVTWKSG